MNCKSFLRLYVLLFLFGIVSCSPENEVENTVKEETEQPEKEDGQVVEPEFPRELVYPIVSELGELLLNDSKSSKGYVLVNDTSSDRVFLMDKDSVKIVHEWELSLELGNDAELLPNGKLLVSLGAENPSFSFGGFGGVVQILNLDGSIEWEFSYASETHLIHHDVEMLPNGNVLALVWELKTLDEAKEKGYLGTEEAIYPESIIEISPITNEIVWRWDSWNQLIQDVDPEKENYATLSDHPELININFTDELSLDVKRDGDFMYANGLDYDEANDLIYLSVNFYSEVWVIDHSTTSIEAKGGSGGNYDKGGELVYRFGNPSAYSNELGQRIFYNNHFPNLIEDDFPGNRNMLIYVNGSADSEQSMVYELKIPNSFRLLPNVDNELDVVWSYTRQGLFSPRVSGAVRLDNGNTLITSGSSGILEVTNDKEVVWEFTGKGFYWRSYHYNLNNEVLLFLQ